MFVFVCLRLESERRETAQLLQRTVSSLSEERAQLRQQLEEQREQAQAAAETRLQAQARLVQKLREILLRKEQQHHALARVLKDIKVGLWVRSSDVLAISDNYTGRTND